MISQTFSLTETHHQVDVQKKPTLYARIQSIALRTIEIAVFLATVPAIIVLSPITVAFTAGVILWERLP